MNKLSERNKNLCTKSEVSLNKSTQSKQLSAQLEAALSRKENQKVTEKSKISSVSCIKKFQTHNSYLRIEKTAYK